MHVVNRKSIGSFEKRTRKPRRWQKKKKTNRYIDVYTRSRSNVNCINARTAVAAKSDTGADVLRAKTTTVNTVRAHDRDCGRGTRVIIMVRRNGNNLPLSRHRYRDNIFVYAMVPRSRSQHGVGGSGGERGCGGVWVLVVAVARYHGIRSRRRSDSGVAVPARGVTLCDEPTNRLHINGNRIHPTRSVVPYYRYATLRA